MVALCCVPCACNGCLSQLDLPWEPSVPARMQQPYQPVGVGCKLWQIFEGLNDWKIMTLKLPKDGDTEELEETQAEVLEGIVDQTSDDVVPGGYGAVNCDVGFYVINWTSHACALQEDEEWGEFEPAMKVNAGEIVCNGCYLEPLPGAASWYTHSPSELQNTKVVLKHVLVADLNLVQPSPDLSLPNSCNCVLALQHNPVKILHAEHNRVQDEMHKREAIDHEEEYPDDEDFSTDNSLEDDSEQTQKNAKLCKLKHRCSVSHSCRRHKFVGSHNIKGLGDIRHVTAPTKV